MKKMPILLLALTLTILSFTGHAQTGFGKVTGRISDGNRAVEAATITLLLARDSSVAKMEMSQKTGQFEIDNIDHGR